MEARGGRALPFAALAALTALAAAGCAGGPAPPAQGQVRLQAQAPEAAWVGDARKVAMSVPPKLLTVLTAEIDRAGAASAIAVCRERFRAREGRVGRDRLAGAARQPAPAQPEGRARRVGARGAGRLRPPRRRGRVAGHAGEGRAGARSKAAPCSALHARFAGAAHLHAVPRRRSAAQPGVAERLRELYPEDRGTGYRPGEIRGAMTIGARRRAPGARRASSSAATMRR
ncbi:MAG: hypothetical protein U1F49_14500 [Rubrivivax sp.]